MIWILVSGPTIFAGNQLTNAVGRPSGDRQWVECYAQLVGTVLSLWDGAALDAAGGEEVPATFINLADASIKMVSPDVCLDRHELTFVVD